MKIKMKKLHPNAIIPKYASDKASCFDLYTIEDIWLAPHHPKTISIGLAVELPENTELQIRPRSGIALKDGISVFNSPGTVDEDFRGEIKVMVYWNGGIATNFNTSYHAITDSQSKNYNCKCIEIPAGTRIAQAAVCPIYRVDIEEVDELSNTARGTGGFGSTGVN